MTLTFGHQSPVGIPGRSKMSAAAEEKLPELKGNRLHCKAVMISSV